MLRSSYSEKSQFQMLRLWKTFQLTPLRNLRFEVVETEEVTSFAEIMPITPPPFIKTSIDNPSEILKEKWASLIVSG
jgi:hypothetical protein